MKQPIWHVLVLGVLTFKIYLIYWCYKNWRDLSTFIDKPRTAIEGSPPVLEPDLAQSPAGKIDFVDSLGPQVETNTAVTEDSELLANSSNETVLDEFGPDGIKPVGDGQDGGAHGEFGPSFLERLLPDHLASFKDVSPILRAVVCLFPYINNYLYFTLALGIARLYPVKTSFVSAHPFVCAFAVLIANVLLSLLSWLNQAYYLLFLLSVIPMAIVQHWLNCYWDSVEEPGLLVRHGFSLKELVVIIAGALYMGYIIASFIMGSSK